MLNPDIRWKQRFSNYRQAFARLSEAIHQDSLNELERNGLVQRFEFTLELGWKVLKDFLSEQGFHFKPSTKDTLRQAQEAGYIDYAQALIDGLDLRNLLSHDYDGKKFEAAEQHLRTEVFPALQHLLVFFQQQEAES